MNASSGKYYVKNQQSGSYSDITSLFNGLAILKVDGLNERGKPVNIYTAQWINSQTEDFMITTSDNQGNPVVIRENVDIEITFAVSRRYATQTINELSVHDSFINYMTNTDIWIKSAYMGNKEVHCVCLAPYKPTTTKLNRMDSSFISGTLKLHVLG